MEETSVQILPNPAPPRPPLQSSPASPIHIGVEPQHPAPQRPVIVPQPPSRPPPLTQLPSLSKHLHPPRPQPLNLVNLVAKPKPLEPKVPSGNSSNLAMAFAQSDPAQLKRLMDIYKSFQTQTAGVNAQNPLGPQAHPLKPPFPNLPHPLIAHPLIPHPPGTHPLVLHPPGTHPLVPQLSSAPLSVMNGPPMGMMQNIPQQPTVTEADLKLLLENQVNDNLPGKE